MHPGLCSKSHLLPPLVTEQDWKPCGHLGRMGGKGPCGRHTGWLWMLALHPNNHPVSPCKESKPHREKGVSPELFRPYQTRNEAEHPRNCQGKEEILREGGSLPDGRREEKASSAKAPNLAPPALSPASSKELTRTGQRIQPGVDSRTGLPGQLGHVTKRGLTRRTPGSFRTVLF